MKYGVCNCMCERLLVIYSKCNSLIINKWVGAYLQFPESGVGTSVLHESSL